MIITNSRYALVCYFITSYPTRAHGIIVIYPTRARGIINNYHFQISFNLKVILHMVKMSQTNVTEKKKKKKNCGIRLTHTIIIESYLPNCLQVSDGKANLSAISAQRSDISSFRLLFSPV